MILTKDIDVYIMKKDELSYILNMIEENENLDFTKLQRVLFKKIFTLSKNWQVKLYPSQLAKQLQFSIAATLKAMQLFTEKDFITAIDDQSTHKVKAFSINIEKLNSIIKEYKERKMLEELL
jgi:hypothetical protein